MSGIGLREGWRKLLVGAGAFALILVAVYFVDLESRLEEINETEHRLAVLKETYLAKSKESAKLGLYRQQLVEIEKKFGQSLAVLPARYNDVFVEIMQAARARGLRVDHLESGEVESVRDFYAEVPGSLKVTGSFNSLANFVNDVAALRGMVTLYELKVAATPTGGGVTMEATVAAHRYLDDDEIAVRRAAARKKKSKK